MNSPYASWGLQPPAQPAEVRPIHWRDQAPALVSSPGLLMLPFGRGRSYGDVCLNHGARIIPTAALDRFIAYDAASGLLTAEAGVTFGQILRLVVPDGWFTPVTPGTRHLSLGGAVANDVHGKEHAWQGTFGRRLQRFVLWRSREGALVCSETENLELFRATIGGLGLTGLITEVTFQLQRIPGPVVETENRAGESIDALAEMDAPYSVAWLDASARGAGLGRGVATRGHFVAGEAIPERRVLPIPPVFPSGLMNHRVLNVLNHLRWQVATRRPARERVSYEQFFYPLDRLAGWNRLFGPRGFYQHQCVIPRAAGTEPIRDLLRAMQQAGASSFVSVLKKLGSLPSPGMLSFPMEGLSLALDLPNTGRPVLELLDRMDKIVVVAGGRLYPAKDARMSPATFRAGYPQWEAFARHIDPAFSSSFWRRVTAL